MKDICKLLEEIQPEHRLGIVFLPERNNFYWLGLPAYANLYIRRPYEMVTCVKGFIEFMHHFLLEYSITNNQDKKTAIEAVVFPLYSTVMGFNYDTEIFKAFGIDYEK